jgi:acetylornithine deacetylase/succinyl-diaminopimelate desuccinylase-like protein
MNPLDELAEFIRFPSVSADSQFKSHILACADWLLAKFKSIGLSASKYPTAGQPVIVASNERRADRKTVLIYGHYDVQPADPLDLWDTPPFEPIVQGDKIYGRGSTDNKGQILAHILGVEATLKEKGDLPVNLIFLIEGEEEIGSPSLAAFLKSRLEELAADVVALSDTGMVAPGVPTFTYGLRGILCLELRLRGPGADLHSGIFGGSVANPATVLSQLLSKLHDKSGRVAIPGFYDRVVSLAEWERALWAKLPFTSESWLATTGSRKLAGEVGYTFLEQVWARPTAEINGLGSGYQGEGSKTIIPSKAMAKLSFRLVPDQDPDELREIVTQFLEKECPDSVEIEFVPQHEGKPYLVNPNSEFAKAAQRALVKTFDKEIAFIREGGSVPITQTFKEVLGTDSLLLGLALPDCRAHSPNENFSIENFYAGIRLNQYLLDEIAQAP